MKVIKEKIGDTQVIIQANDEKIEVIGGKRQTGDRTQPSGITEDLEDAYAKAKTLISTIAMDMGQHLKELGEQTRPKEVEVEFGLGFSAQAKVWMIGGEAEAAMKVTLKWEL
jgi:hypothetical protein